MHEYAINYTKDISNQVVERYYYIVYRLLKSQCNKVELRLILSELNIDLKQMTNLDRKNWIKRFLVEYQFFPIIECSINEKWRILDE